MDEHLIQLARQVAQRHNLDADIFCAQVERESSWNPLAVRYEPAFRDRYVAPKHLELSEEIARSHSYGLLQVMGEVAREFGYAGQLAGLFDPELGLEWGARVVAHKIAVNGGNVERGLLAYNGGGNPSYAADIVRLSSKYKV